MAVNQWGALVLVAGSIAGFAWLASDFYRQQREVERWNNASTPEEIQALLPPGHRYDPDTRLCYPPELGALPYRRGEKGLRP